MKGSMSTDLGIITINPEVIAKYAGSVAVECFGIVGIAALHLSNSLPRSISSLINHSDTFNEDVNFIDCHTGEFFYFIFYIIHQIV